MATMGGRFDGGRFAGSRFSGGRWGYLDSVFDAAILYANGEAGDYFDPSDLSRMFQDTAGTTPVTTDGQTVARIDGQLGRVSLQQSTAANRPLYGFAPATGVRNLLTKTEDFSDGVWVKENVAVAKNATKYDGTLNGAWTVTDDVTSGMHRIYQVISPASSGARSILVKAGTLSFVGLSANGLGYAAFNLSTGSVAIQSGVIGVINHVSDGWYRCAINGTGFFLILNVGATAASVNPGATYSGSGGTVFVDQAQLELGSTATAYQKVNTQYGVTESGIPTVHYLKFDGTNDSLASAATLDMTGTDEVTVAAGVYKASDASARNAVSHGTSATAGAFWITAPDAVSASYGFASRGSATATAAYTNAGVAAPNTSVVVGLGDISADSALLRINGVQQATSATDQGTGNRANATLVMGAGGAGTGAFHNGNIYYLLIRGKLTTGTDLTGLEGLVASKTGVTPP